MKQLFTLLICAGAFTTSFAQYHPGHRDDNTTYNQNGHFEHGKPFIKDRGFLVMKINREYDSKIRAIQNDWTLRRHQKKVAVRALERERERQLRQVKERSRHY
jgi:hypothetical protein